MSPITAAAMMMTGNGTSNSAIAKKAIAAQASSQLVLNDLDPMRTRAGYCQANAGCVRFGRRWACSAIDPGALSR